MRPLPLLLALALVPLALPTASATTCSTSDTTVDGVGTVHAEAGSKCLGLVATTCDPVTGCRTTDLADLFPCLFCPGPVLW